MMTEREPQPCSRCSEFINTYERGFYAWGDWWILCSSCHQVLWNKGKVPGSDRRPT